MKVKIGKYPKQLSKHRKIKIKIDDSDVYNLDTTLAHIILPTLKKLHEIKHGAPNVDNEDVPVELHRINEEEYNVDDKWFDRWDYVLEQMIWSFSELLRDWESDYYSGKHDWKSIPVDKDGNKVSKKDAEFFEMVKGPKHTFEIDSEGMKKHKEKIQNGLNLFAKYYMALWS